MTKSSFKSYVLVLHVYSTIQCNSMSKSQGHGLLSVCLWRLLIKNLHIKPFHLDYISCFKQGNCWLNLKQRQSHDGWNIIKQACPNYRPSLIRERYPFTITPYLCHCFGQYVHLWTSVFKDETWEEIWRTHWELHWDSRCYRTRVMC